MKREINIKLIATFLLILLCFNILPIINAQLEENSLERGIEDLEESKETVENTLTNENVRNEYLLKEWSEILKETKLGKFLNAIGNILQSLNPLFKLIVGIEYSLSWIFFLTLGVNIVLIILLYRPLRDFVSLNPFIVLLIGLVFLSLIGLTKAIPNTLTAMAPLFSNKFNIVMSIIITIVLVSIYEISMKKFGKKFKEIKDKEEKERRELLEKGVATQNEMKLKKGI